jgi:RNA polymerase sigma-70 factor, ECF subfamily
MGDCVFRGGKAILAPTVPEGVLELFTFDKSYVDRLRDGEPATEQHFVSYFGRILGIMLRARYLPQEKVDDVRQETMTRVIAILRRDGGVRQPERFGAFVNSVCKNVLRESARDWHRSEVLQSEHLEVPDKVVDIERSLITQQTKEKVREILGEMKPRDRDVLRAVFLEDKEKDEVCQQFGVGRQYLRVLLHRAKERFRSSFARESEKVRAASPNSEIG